MKEDEMIDKLIDGYSLYTYMVPDDSIPTNRPLHSEGFHLPHIIITKNIFWGMSRTVHFFQAEDNRRGVYHFCYTNDFRDLFFSYNPTSQGAVFMSTKRYKRHQFIMKNEWKLVWDSEWTEKQQNYEIDCLIEQGSCFKIAMLDSENIWNIHPVDLPMYHINKGSFNLKTEYFEYASVIRDIKHVNELVEANKEFFSKKPISNEGGALLCECAPFHAFYCLFNNGEYCSFYDAPRGSIQKYNRLKVFCEKME